MPSVLDQLRAMTTVVADTGDVDAVRRLNPVDCTTNPSLVLSALQGGGAQELIEREIRHAQAVGKTPGQIVDTLTVALGAELTKLIPGRVSTEVNASLSFDTVASVERAHAIVADYETRGVPRKRILIKLAATWEGIRAAEILQRDGIDCNLTLLFSMAQAIACADAGVFLISPFVGRITDWYKRAEGAEDYPTDKDPGVQSVRRIYDYYKSNNIETIIMGASFRTTTQVKALAGCDNLTISPKLLDALEAEEAPLSRMLSPESVSGVDRTEMNEPGFRWAVNADAMATEQLSEGIRKFHADHQALVSLVSGL